MFRKKHTHQIDLRVNTGPETVAEFGTGIMLLKATAIEKEAQIEKMVGFDFAYVPSSVFFRAGTVLNWDYLKMAYRGKPQYFKRQSDIEVDAQGNPINTAAPAPAASTTAGKTAAPVRKAVKKTVKRSK